MHGVGVVSFPGAIVIANLKLRSRRSFQAEHGLSRRARGPIAPLRNKPRARQRADGNEKRYADAGAEAEAQSGIC